MNLEQIITFLQVYQLQSFKEAAYQMYLPQPTISQRIIQLEKELGKKLLIRSKGKITLTEEGRAFLPYAQYIQGALLEGKEAVNKVEQGTIGKLSIGCNTPLTSSVLPYIIDTFSERYPKVSIDIDTSSTPLLVRLIRQRQIQLAITPHTNGDPGLIYQNVFSEPYCLIVSPTHPFAQKGSVTLEEISHEPLIIYRKNTLYRDMIDIIMIQENLFYKAKFETNNMQLIKHLIKKNAGVHISGKVHMRDEIIKNELVAVSIEPNPFALSRIYVARLNEKVNNLEEEFLEYFETALKETFLSY